MYVYTYKDIYLVCIFLFNLSKRFIYELDLIRPYTLIMPGRLMDWNWWQCQDFDNVRRRNLWGRGANGHPTFRGKKSVYIFLACIDSISFLSNVLA